MGSIIKLFKNLIGGIVGFIGGLLGGKKSSGGFFMELDEAQVSKDPVAEVVATTTAPATSAKAAKQAIKAVKAEAAAVEPTAPAINPLNLPQPTVSFAETNQVPLATPRRRPGANMNSYLNMAKTMNQG